MTLSSQLSAVFQFLKTRDGHYLQQLDTSWSGFGRSILVVITISVFFAFLIEGLETDPELRVLDDEYGWLSIIINSIFLKFSGLVAWFYLAWIFGWQTLYRQAMTYLNWLSVVIEPLVTGIFFTLSDIIPLLTPFNPIESLTGIFAAIAIMLLPTFYYSVLALGRGCNLSFKISLVTVVLFTCFDLFIIYKVLV